MRKTTETPDALITLPDGRAISYCDYGGPGGIPIFQFHGTPGSRIFGLDNEEVAKAGLRILAPERPGYGKSSPNPKATAVSDWVSDVDVLADHLKLDRFHVIGVSGGGPFALACAALLPQRVMTATVISSPSPMDFAGFWDNLSFFNRSLFYVSRSQPALLPAVCTALAMLMKDRQGRPTHQGEAFRQGRIGIETDLKLLSREWNIPLESIAVPVFLWHGERDTLASPTAARELAKTIPACESHFVPGAGHFLSRDPLIAQRVLDRILEAK
jgi:pimeloyl-ACP methyl ester carboxylesterase